jgi:hypothetical protein
MQTLLDEVVRAGGQIIVLSVVPFIFWLFAARKKLAIHMRLYPLFLHGLRT